MSALTAMPAHDYPFEGDLMYSAAGKSYAQVVDRILGKKPQSGQVLVTSAASAEGKTITAINLALAFHARRIPVLLVELSLVRPRLRDILGSPTGRLGVEDALAGRAPISKTIQRMEGNSLPFAMVLRAQDGYERLAPNAHLDQLLADAQKDYRWTIFDGPAILSSPYICSLSTSVGLTLMVARAQHTKRQTFYEAYARIHDTRPMVLLNDEQAASA